MNKPHVLLTDDDELVRDSAADTLRREGYDVTPCDSAEAAVRCLTQRSYDVLLTDLRMPGMSGIELLERARQRQPELTVVLMTAFATVRTAVEAMKLGAYDYLQKPFDADELRTSVLRATEHARLRRDNRTLRDEVQALRAALRADPPPPIAGDTPETAALRRTIGRVAASAATVLIRGESGSGKDLVARHLHASGDRRDKPLLVVNCASLDESRLEAELFGVEPADADAGRKGRLEIADGGTVLLDEIGDLRESLQAKLLRVLQERTFERVGGTRPVRVDVRVIATTHRDLNSAVETGAFRRDLFYRLNVVPIDVPPLRERAGDVPALCDHLLTRLAGRTGGVTREIEPAAVRLLQRHRWPGNVRELHNLLERAVVLESDARTVRAATILPWLQISPPTPATSGEGLATPSTSGAGTEPLAIVEKRVILTTLDRFNGHREKTAKALGIGVRTLGMKLKKWRDDQETAEVGSSGSSAGMPRTVGVGAGC